jgi:DNA-directed RNA polymerase specialized sigma24 family protein
MSDETDSSQSGHSVTRLIVRLKSEDSDAAGEIWRRYVARLLPLARARLASSSDRAGDEEDVMVSVFERFFRAAGENRFAKLNDRDDLWQILLMLTDRNVTQRFRRASAEKRDAGKAASLDALADAAGGDLRELVEREPSPDDVAAFNDSLTDALARLGDDRIREIAILKLEGHENAEIARRTNVSLSSVERKLRLIREKWQDRFEN